MLWRCIETTHGSLSQRWQRIFEIRVFQPENQTEPKTINFVAFLNEKWTLDDRFVNTKFVNKRLRLDVAHVRHIYEMKITAVDIYNICLFALSLFRFVFLLSLSHFTKIFTTEKLCYFNSSIVFGSFQSFEIPSHFDFDVRLFRLVNRCHLHGCRCCCYPRHATHCN